MSPRFGGGASPSGKSPGHRLREQDVPVSYMYGGNATLAAAAKLRKRMEEKEMTMSKLKEICREYGQPSCPMAVTQLELNCQLFTEIGPAISEYGALRILSLARNHLTEIAHLERLTQMQCLYLSHNRIERTVGLHTLSNLQVLDLAANRLTKLEGLETLCNLEILILHSNKLANTAALAPLPHLTRLGELDISNNAINDPSVIDMLGALPCLANLLLFGNPVAHAPRSAAEGPALVPNYRRTLVQRCTALTALDHNPVTAHERRAAEAVACEKEEAAHKADSEEIPADSLFAVFARLDAASLVKCALTCHWWRNAARPALLRSRVAMAEAAFDAVDTAPAEAMVLLRSLKAEDFSSLKDHPLPQGQTVQLAHACAVPWAAACGTPLAVCSEDEEYPDLSSSTARARSWDAARPMLADPSFPTALGRLPPMGEADVARLRGRSGSANDLDVYVPELCPRLLSSYDAALGSLARWLLLTEKYWYAVSRLQAAYDAAGMPHSERLMAAMTAQPAEPENDASTAKEGEQAPEEAAEAAEEEITVAPLEELLAPREEEPEEGYYDSDEAEDSDGEVETNASTSVPPSPCPQPRDGASGGGTPSVDALTAEVEELGMPGHTVTYVVCD